MEVRSVVKLLGDPGRGLAFAQLLEAMGEVQADAARREARLRHALEVVEAVRARSPRHAEAAALEARLRRALSRGSFE